MRWCLLLCCCCLCLAGAERIALVAAPGGDEQAVGDARLVADGLRHAGYTVETCQEASDLPAACARFTARALHGGVLGVVWYGAPVAIDGGTVRLGGAGGVDAAGFVAGLAAVPHSSLLVALEAQEGGWPLLLAPPGCALVLSPRQGVERSGGLAGELVARLLMPDAQAGPALLRLRRDDPSLIVDSKLSRQVSLAPSAVAAPGPAATSDRELTRLYLATMRAGLATVRATHLTDGAPARLRIRAWLAFLGEFRVDAAGSDEDEAMRGEAVRTLLALGAANPLAGAPPPPVLGLRDHRDPLPDMRWVVEWALRVAADPEATRPARVRAWAAVVRLFPDDDPRTDNDDIWRRIAREALRELDAAGAALPPLPPVPAQPPPPPTDAAATLGLELAPPGDGPGLRIIGCSGLGRSLGLAPGVLLTAADGQQLARPADLAAALSRGRAMGTLTLDLAGGARCTIRLPVDEDAVPELAEIAWSGRMAEGGPAVRPDLALAGGVAVITSQLAPTLRLRLAGGEPADRTPIGPLRTSFVDLAEPVALELDRRGLAGGAWLLTVRPLHLLALSDRLRSAGDWTSRIALPTLAGEPLWIEAGCLTPIELSGSDAAGNLLAADALPPLPGLPYRLVIRCAGDPLHLPLQTLRSGGIATATARSADHLDGDVRWRVGLTRRWEWK
jgi:hypothetical protein